MGIFSSLRNIVSGGTEENSLWNRPQSVEAVIEILNSSKKPQLLYKHSYSCAISFLAKNSLDSGLESLAKEADLHLIDVSAQRELSRRIAEATGIRHESPQLILMHLGHPYWHASHGGVRINSLLETMNDLNGATGDES
jgi:bacillithiol system protein YtxJ